MKILFFVWLSLWAVSASAAGLCGEGKVISVMTGGWDTDNLFVLLDYSISPSQLPNPPSPYKPWTIFQKNHLDPVRFKTLTALAISAMQSNQNVWIYTQTDTCENATAIGVGFHPS